jgi:hypothetical protein
MSSSIIVAGIDVGGNAKGFHAVALRCGASLDKSNSCDPLKVAEWVPMNRDALYRSGCPVLLEF